MKNEKNVENATVKPEASATANTATAAAAAAAPVTAAPKGRFEIPAEVVTASNSRGGSRIRPNVGYEVIGVPKAGVKLQPQCLLMLDLVNRNTSDTKPVIAEPELQKIVAEAKSKGVLKTKQDAWRIFTYYRTDLVKAGYLREVAIAVQ